MGESRPLGEHERLLHYMHGHGGLITLMVLHVRGPLDPEAVARALLWLQRQHPMLRAHIRYGGLVFRNIPPFVYRQPAFDTEGTLPVPLRVAEGDWNEILTAELGKPLPRGKTPRLRVTLVPDADMTHVVIASDHATIDAQSCNMLARELLEHLADPAGCEALPPAQDALPPPSESGARKSDSGTKSYEPALRLPLRPEPGARKPETLVLSRRLEDGAAATLKDVARSKGATLHGTVTAAFLVAMRQQFGVEAMTCLSSVDLRRFSTPPLPADTYGCFIDVLRTRHEIAPELWRTARDVSFKLVGAIAKDQETASMLKLPGWPVYRVETGPAIRHLARLDGLAVTTAGDSGLSARYGNHTLEDVTMAVSIEPVGPTMMVICSERLGGLDFGINYGPRTLSTAQAVALTDSALSLLKEAVATTAAGAA